jgi:hypothetical protein
MAEELKDLGGLVNKDMAFSKVQPNVVYDSKNFRVTTDDGATLAVRSNIKGNTFALQVPDVPCKKTIQFDITKITEGLFTLQDYSMQFYVEIVDEYTTFSFTYTTYQQLLQDFVTFIQTDAAFLAAGITVIGNTYSVVNDNGHLYGNISLLAGEAGCGSIAIGPLTSTSAVDTTSLGFSPIDEEFQNIVPYTPSYQQFNNASNTYTFSGTFPSLAPAVSISPTFTNGATDPINQWKIENKYCQSSSSSPAFLLPDPDYYMYVNMGTGVYDTSYNLIPGTSAVTTLLYNDLWRDSVFDSRPNTAIISYSVIGENLYNIEDYSADSWNYDFSYAIGNMDTRSYVTTLKVYLYMGDSWSDSSFTYEYPDTNISGFLDGTRPCGLVYTQILNPGQDNLKITSNNVTGIISFTDTPYNNGATEKPVYIIFIERTSLATDPNYSLELYLDYFKVTARPINLTIATVLNDYYGVDAPIIIGWTTLREDIYLFTTSNQQDPEDPAYIIGDGQIWRFTYDKTGDYSNPSTYNIELVYNNPALDFTTWRPIANPGMIEARYENKDIQKIYWTDNYNVPRQINVAPSQASVTANLTIDQLNLIPSLTMELPYITQIVDGGDLNAGVYQVIYRLKNLNNSETRFSRPSNSIPLFEAGTSTDYDGYYPGTTGIKTTINYPVTASTNGTPPTGTPINSRKGIRININNVDTNYNEIEFATIYYKSNNDVPEIKIVKKETIPADGKIDTYIWGNEDAVDITLEESTAFTTAIRRCKTLTAKKQTLFLGNITVTGQEVEYDTRVYRFPINEKTTSIYDSQGNEYTVDADLGYMITAVNGVAMPTPYLVPKDHDCIQPYSQQAPTDDKNLLYKVNSNVLGGSGINLEYEFYTDSFVLDSVKLNDANTSSSFARPFPNDFVTFDSLGTTPYYSQGSSFTNYASPYKYDTYVGYRRDEMYRFGMVFYDNLDNPTYVNWIGDIRMPHIWMPDTTYDANPAYAGGGNRTRIGIDWFNKPFCSDLTYFDSTNNYLYAKPLALKVTILNPPDSVFTHGSIVRAEKTDSDKHILGQGIIRPAFKLCNDSPKSGTHAYLSPPGKFGNDNGPNNQNYAYHNLWSMHSPEFMQWIDGDEPTNNIIESTKFPGWNNTHRIDFLGLLDEVDAGYPQWNAAGQGGVQNTNGLGSGIKTEVNNRGGSPLSYLYYLAQAVKNYQFIEAIDSPNSIKNTTGVGIIDVVKAQSLNNPSTNQNKYNTTVTDTTNTINIVQSVPIVYHANPSDPAPYHLASGGYQINSGQWATGAYTAGDTLMLGFTGKNLFVELNGPQSYLDWSTASGNFFNRDQFFSDPSKWRNYLANYTANIPDNSVYGGNSYFSRANTEYIFCNNFFRVSPTGTTSTIVYGGDTVITLFDNTLDFFDGYGGHELCNPSNGNWASGVFPAIYFRSPNVYSRWLASIFPVETSIPINYRRVRDTYYHDTIQESGNAGEVTNRFSRFTKNKNPDISTNSVDWGNANRIEEWETFRIDSVFLYNYTRSIYRFFPKTPNAIIPNTYDCRIWRSQEKTDGEQVESWSVYKPDLYKDVESAYGPINNLIIFQDKMFYFQDKGFGVAQVDEQKVVQSGDNTASDLVLGSSGILERYDYISTKTGTKHQFSMSVSDYSIIWFDALARKMYRYKPSGLEPVSDIKGLNAFLYSRLYGVLQTNDNPYRFRGIHSTYDFRHNEFYMTFLDASQDTPLELTLVYNDLLDGYVGEYTHYPKVYINDKLNIFSPNPNVVLGVDNEEIYIHNYGNYATFYDQTPDFSTLSFILNSNPTIEKVLNNLEFVVEAFKPNRLGTYDLQYDAVAQIDFYDFFDDMRVYDNYQNTDWFTLIPNTLDYSGRTNYARKHKSIWNTRIPSDKVITPNTSIFDPANISTIKPSMTRRFKDKWFMIELRYNNTTYTNNLNNKLVVHSAKANYALNSR